MKRYGHLFEEIGSFRTLTRSALQAAKGKKTKPRVALFLQNLENEVIKIEKELRAKTYRPLPYRTFKIHDPKERMICAADFRDRVVHHAVCKALEPIFERLLIFDTYACRTDKGTLRAIKRAQGFCRRYRYFLKLDVLKFFDSVDHAILKTQLRRKVKDADLLWLLDVFIDHPVPWTAPGKGIPIGNLTSQHFANFHLSALDRFIKENLRIEGYIRYMDDLLLFADEKYTLQDAYERIEHYLQMNLSLELKTGGILLAPVFQGLPFLGFRIFPGVIRATRRGWRRFRNKILARTEQLSGDAIGYEVWHRSVASLIGHLQQADTRSLRASFLNFIV